MRYTAIPLLAAAVLVAGCGAQTAQSNHGRASTRVVLAAYKQANRAETSRFTFSMTISAESHSATMRAHGISNYVRHLDRGTLDFSEFVAAAGEHGSGHVELLRVGDAAFYKFPAAVARRLQVRTPWAEVRLKGAGLGFASLESGRNDPAQFLAFLKSAGSVQRSGSASVRGMPTTKYHATVDLRHGAGMRASAAKILQQAGISTAPVDVWIDRGKLPRRIAVALHANIAGQKVTVSDTVDLFDYGVSVHVHRPPANEVTDITQQLANGS